MLEGVNESVKLLGAATVVLLIVLYGIWKLVDKWADKFLKVHKTQAEAMATLAADLRVSTSDSRETLIVIRAFAQQQDDMRDQIERQTTKLNEMAGLMRGLNAVGH